MFLRLASKSLSSRKGAVLLTIFAMSVSVFVMLGVDHIRQQAKSSFASSVSGTDLIVGTRTSSLNLLLYSVFRIGAPTSNIQWKSFEKISEHNQVSWSIPISLGDSHKGYRVLGTNENYFEHFSFGSKQTLTFSEGHQFRGVFDVVLGAKVATKLGYNIGDSVTLSHGIGSTSFTKHSQSPFNVVGILNATGTPVDQTLHVSLQGLEAVHLARPVDFSTLAEKELSEFERNYLTPKSVTAVMIGLKSRMMVFNFQREINNDISDPLLAILPGVALSELWQTMSMAESALRLVSALVLVSALLGLSAMLLTSIRERNQEIKLLRMIGASPLFIYWFIELEALLITLVSITLGMAALMLSISISRDYLLSSFGIALETNIFSTSSVQALCVILLFAFLAAVPSALSAFRTARR